MRFSSNLILFVLLLINTAVEARNNIEGLWYHDGHQTSIQAYRHHQYTFCNENNDCKGGYVFNDTIQVPQWNVSGQLRNHQQVIEWSNGTNWMRGTARPAQFWAPNVGGIWYHNGRPTTIKLQNQHNFILINEVAQVSRGVIKNNMLFIPSLNISGRLSPDGRMITWSNRTMWTR